MAKQPPFLRWFLPAVLLYTVGFIVATFYDLRINVAVYTPGSLFAILMEAFGWYPAFLPPILLALLYTVQPGHAAHTRPWLRVPCGVVAATGLAFLYLVSFGYLAKRGLLVDGADPATWLWTATAVMASATFLLIVTRFAEITRKKLSFFAIFGTLYLIIGQIILYFFKFVWGRPRFDDMLALGSFALFRPWYLPLGPGGTSLPSGHTGNAAGILILIILCDLFPNWNRRKRLVTALCWGYIGAMAVARIIIGRHFLSDTLAASAMMGLAFYTLKNANKYRLCLQKTLKNTAKLPGEP